MHVIYKGRPVTKETLADLNALFAMLAKKKHITPEFAQRLVDAGVEVRLPTTGE